MNKYFIDLGSNSLQSLRYYTLLFPETTSDTVALCIQTSYRANSLPKLRKNLLEVANSYRSIFIFNYSVSIAHLFPFQDPPGEEVRITTINYPKSWKKLFSIPYLYLKSKIQYLISFSSYNFAPSLFSFLPTSYSSCDIDLKVNASGTQYDLISSLAQHNHIRLLIICLLKSMVLSSEVIKA